MSHKENGKRQVAPLEHVVRLEGNVVQRKWKEVSKPLEHIVHLEGNIVQRKQKEVSGTLGACSAS
jgi:hypothetical protein